MARAVEKVEMLKAELEAYRELLQGLLRKVQELEAEVGKVRLVEDVADALEELAERLERLERLEEEVGRILAELRRWRRVWICWAVTPHEEPVANRKIYEGLMLKAMPRLPELARHVRRARDQWREYTAMLVRLGKNFIFFDKAAADKFIQTYKRLFDDIIVKLRAAGYQTEATVECTEALMTPEYLMELLRAQEMEIEEEVKETEKLIQEKKLKGESTRYQLEKLRKLREKLYHVRQLIRQLLQGERRLEHELRYLLDELERRAREREREKIRIVLGKKEA